MTATFTGKFAISHTEIKFPAYTILKVEKLDKRNFGDEVKGPSS